MAYYQDILKVNIGICFDEQWNCHWLVLALVLAVILKNLSINISTIIDKVQKVEFFAYHFWCAMISLTANKFCASDLK